MAKVVGIDLAHHELGGGVPWRDDAHRHHQRRRQPAHAVGRRVHEKRRAPRRPVGQAAGDHESRSWTVASIKRHMGTDFKVTIDGMNYTPTKRSRR